MGRKGPLRVALEMKSVEELNEIRSEFCDTIGKYNGDKGEFARRIRDSIKRSIDDGEYDYDDVFNYLFGETNHTASTRIHHCLEEIEFSNSATHGDGSLKEAPLIGELFQALRLKFIDTRYSVYDERVFGKYRPDLAIEGNGKTYIIEVKNHGSISSLLNKLQNYTEDINQDGVYVFYVTDNRGKLPDQNESIRNTLGGAENYHNAHVIVKGPECFRGN